MPWCTQIWTAFVYQPSWESGAILLSLHKNRLAIQQKDERRQDNSERRRLVRQHPSNLFRSLTRDWLWMEDSTVSSWPHFVLHHFKFSTCLAWGTCCACVYLVIDVNLLQAAILSDRWWFSCGLVLTKLIDNLLTLLSVLHTPRNYLHLHTSYLQRTVQV